MEVQFETSPKGFKVLPVTRSQCFHWGGQSICDHCGHPFISAMYVAVLNEAVCIPCYLEWHTRSRYYTEDAVVEQRNVEKMKLRLQDYNG